MQIPFADALLSRLSRRGAGLELIEEIEDEDQSRSEEHTSELQSPA